LRLHFGVSAPTSAFASVALGVFLAAQLFPVSAGASTIYDAVGDFSVGVGANSPSSIWQYGTGTPGSFSNFVDTDLGVGIPGVDAWEDQNSPQGYPNGDATPYIAQNTTGTTIDAFGFEIPTDELQMHPGDSANLPAVVQWTAPVNSVITIDGLFEGLDTGQLNGGVGTTTNVLILLNGVPIYSNEVTGFGTQDTFGLMETVTAGSTVDFVVGFGTNLNNGFDSTGLKAVITANATTVPEPVTLGSVGICLLGLGLFRYTGRRNRRH